MCYPWHVPTTPPLLGVNGRPPYTHTHTGTQDSIGVALTLYSGSNHHLHIHTGTQDGIGGIGADRNPASAIMGCVSSAYRGAGGTWAFGRADPPNVASAQWDMPATPLRLLHSLARSGRRSPAPVAQTAPDQPTPLPPPPPLPLQSSARLRLRLTRTTSKS